MTRDATTRDATTSFARALVDEWVRGGVTDAVVAPGSRSAPLALALGTDDRIRVHVILDERAAAFVALGFGRATGRPAVVLTTSGTAAANLHPAVLEAHHGCVPLIACTADRPPELRDTGAPQTIDQVHLFGNAVRWFVDAEVPTDRPDAGRAWRALGARSVAQATGSPSGSPAGPVHLNLPLREPLVPTGAPLVDAPGRADGAPWTGTVGGIRPICDAAEIDALAARVRAEPRGVLLCGGGCGVRPETARRFGRASGWPIVADPLSGVGGSDGVVGAYEALARTDRFTQRLAPVAAVRVGAAITSTTFTRWLDDADTETTIVDPAAGWRDPVHSSAAMIDADPEELLAALALRLEEFGAEPDRAWVDAWMRVDAHAQSAIDATLDGWSECSEPRVARDLVRALPAGATLVVASSMPVREVEWFSRPGTTVRVISNRGVNGIDGFVSTALGIALGSAGPVVALTGDLCFLHDGGGLLAARGTGANVVFVVVDNRGGGIFSFLPQAQLPEHFETLFGTPPVADLAAIAAAHGFSVISVDRPAGLADALDGALAGRGPTVVVVRTDRARNVEHHREVWDAVASALSEW